MSAVAINNALYRSKADARAREFIHTMKPLKGIKKLVHICHIKPYTVIPYEINCLSDFRLQIADCGLRNRNNCGMRNAECRMQN